MQPLLLIGVLAGAGLVLWGCLGWPLDSLHGTIIEAAGALVCVTCVQRLTAT